MDKTLSYPDNLLSDIVNGAHVPIAPFDNRPSDFPGTLEYVLMSLDKPRDIQALRLRYQEKMTLNEVGQSLGVGTERARQIVNRGLRKMRHPTRIEYLRYGVAGKAQRDAEKKAHEAVVEAVETIKRAEARDKLQLERKYRVDLSNSVDPQKVSVAELGLSVRAFNCLYRSNIKSLADLLTYSLSQLREIRAFGAMCEADIVKALADRGYELQP